MKPLFTSTELENAKSTDLLSVECYYCQSSFLKEKRYIIRCSKSKRHSAKYCSEQCLINHKQQGEILKCNQCDKQIYKILSVINSSKSGNFFCSKTCAVTYNNTHKTTGTRRSKLEVWLEEQLTILYPSLSIDFNKKDAINSELDIYIPSLNLAFELNGIYHYKPIHGQNKLDQIQNNDHRKFQACAEKEISLCIIDTSTLIHFSEKKANVYLNNICEIISGSAGT